MHYIPKQFYALLGAKITQIFLQLEEQMARFSCGMCRNEDLCQSIAKHHVSTEVFC